MITTYHRPQTLEEALTLLAQPNTLPLGGGTLLSHPQSAPVSVVDLQALGLNTITRKGNDLEIGATVTLQQLLESEHCPEALKTAIKLEAPLNLRNSATLAGTLVAGDGRSPVAACLLALDAKITVYGPSSTVSVGEFLPLRPQGLITLITLPAQAKFAFEYTSRTPADKPIVSAALAQWPSGRARLVIGGFGKSPSLAMDGTEADGVDSAARNACHEAADDFASAEYRMDVAATLAKRCLESLQ
ncbi:MAG: FAD binding domain-containing protein [Chloroflexota bacterium]